MNRKIEKNVLEWLLEPEDVGVRYLALRDLVEADAKEVGTARTRSHKEGPISVVLDKMQKEGYWVKPGAGYNPKYTGTVWSIILLAQLGASLEMDKRISIACSYIIDHTLTESGQFTMTGQPSGTIDCLQGNLCASLLDLGYQNPLLDQAFEWMARSQTGDGVAPMTDKNAPVRYYAAKCGPNFACGGTNKLPCAWGAAKVTLAFSKLPEEKKNAFD
jgi:hypothetical protein